MDHTEKVILKQASHVEAGYICTEPVIEEVQSYFYSEKDGVFRKHVFTANDIVVHSVSAQEYPAKASAVLALEDNEIVVMQTVAENAQAVAVEEPVKKPAPKKRATKKSKEGV